MLIQKIRKGRHPFMAHEAGDSLISRFFNPRGIAIIGSFREGHFSGYVIVKSLIGAGYHGTVYPVNPGYKDVLGMRVYPTLRDISGEVDLAIIMVNARTVSEILRACADKGIRSVIVVSDGFAERDEAGARLQKDIVALAKRTGLRIIGPNTAGVVNTANGFNPCPYEAGYSRGEQDL